MNDTKASEDFIINNNLVEHKCDTICCFCRVVVDYLLKYYFNIKKNLVDECLVYLL